jgi:pimeloyl-ACP methyl ester carboxylesterase
MPATDAPKPALIHDGLAVYRFGSGEPVLLMPGPHRFQQPGMRMADALIKGLEQLNRQVITFDPPGSGKSSRPAHLSTLEMHICATETLEACGHNGAVDAMGHSMGGLVTLAYAIEHPPRVKRLVLVGTGSGGPAYMNAPGALWNRSHPAFWRMALLGILQMIWPRLATERWMMNFIQMQSFQDQRLVQTKPIEPEDWLRPKRGRSEWHRVARKLDYSSRLGEIEAPALILCGWHDPQYPPACSQELAAGIPRSKLVFFEHSGHYPFLEEPKAFWKAVREFLA